MVTQNTTCTSLCMRTLNRVRQMLLFALIGMFLTGVKLMWDVPGSSLPQTGDIQQWAFTL